MLFTYPDRRVIRAALPTDVRAGGLWSGSSLDHVVPTNLARNSSQTISAIEITSLQLQRFLGVIKSDRVELCARFEGKCA